MSIADVREILKRDPFLPVRFHSTSGATIEVRKPGLAVMLKSQLFIAKPNSNNFALIPFLHIAAAEVIENGHKARTRRRGRSA